MFKRQKSVAYIFLIAALLAQFVFQQPLLGTVLCCLLCAECLLFAAAYWYYSR